MLGICAPSEADKKGMSHKNMPVVYFMLLRDTSTAYDLFSRSTHVLFYFFLLNPYA